MSRRHFNFGRAPKKGSKLRASVLLMLRPQGATNPEVCEVYGTDYKRGAGGANQVYNVIEALREQKGYDVRTFPLPPHDPRQAGFSDPSTVGRRPVVHRVVGKMRWDGSYRSFVDPTQNRGPIKRPKKK